MSSMHNNGVRFERTSAARATDHSLSWGMRLELRKGGRTEPFQPIDIRTRSRNETRPGNQRCRMSPGASRIYVRK